MSDIYCAPCEPDPAEAESLPVPEETLMPFQVPDIPADPSERQPSLALRTIRAQLEKIISEDFEFSHFSPVKWVLDMENNEILLENTKSNTESEDSDSEGPWIARFYVKTGDSDSSLSEEKPKTTNPLLDQSFCVELKFNSGYPYESPPEVSFHCTQIAHPLTHPLLFNEPKGIKLMPTLFYELFLRMRDGEFDWERFGSGPQSPAESDVHGDGYWTIIDTLIAVRKFLMLEIEKPNPADPEGPRTLDMRNQVVEKAQKFMTNVVSEMDPETAAESYIYYDLTRYRDFRRLVEAYREQRLYPELFEIRQDDEFPGKWLVNNESVNLDSEAETTTGDLSMSESEVQPPILTLLSENIWSTGPLFTPAFCDMLVKEVKNIQAFCESDHNDLVLERPNSMNRYGAILNRVGLEGLMTAIQKKVGRRMRAAIGSSLSEFQSERRVGDMGIWDSHHSFVVQYGGESDSDAKKSTSPRDLSGLDMHTDDSDITFNICLGPSETFKGSEVVFCGQLGKKNHRKEQFVYEQKKGHCLIHLGRHRHGVRDIAAGCERMSLIIWNKSVLRYRQTMEYMKSVSQSDVAGTYEKEGGIPDSVCLSYTHDRDFGAFREYPSKELEDKFRGEGWCPPEGKEYEEFVKE